MYKRQFYQIVESNRIEKSIRQRESKRYKSFHMLRRGHDLRLQKNRARYDLRKFFFTNRVVNIWNSLSDYVVHADTVNCFKSRLDTFWSNQDLVYNFKAEISGTGSRSEVV